MVGPSVRKVLLTTAATATLLAVGACTTASPNAAPSPSVSASTETPTPTPTPTVTASPTATVSPTASGALGALTGAWKGTWTNEVPTTAVGTFTLTWVQQGNLLVGAIGVQGSTCLSGGNVTGSADGNKISFGAVEGNNLISYVGTWSGNTMSGTYTSACGSSRGTWSAIRA